MTVGVAIICKTPEPGKSKTRLSPPLSLDQCAALSECFIRDLSANIQTLCDRRGLQGYAIYTPAGSEDAMRALLPPAFGLILQSEGDLGARLLAGTRDILARGHDAAIIVNADSPTLPMRALDVAVDRLLADEDCVALSPAVDGGYTFVGLKRPHPRLFEDIPWSTEIVHRLTVARAGEIGLPVFDAPTWYDVDDAATLAVLRAELDGAQPPFADARDALAATPATRAFLDALAQAGRVG